MIEAIHTALLRDLRRVAEGKKPKRDWTKEKYNAWHKRFTSSRNYWDIHMGTLASQDPALAAEELEKRLQQEAGEYAPPDEIGTFDAFEISSPTYHGWSVNGLLIAWRDLPERFTKARELLRRHLRTRAVIWACQSQPDCRQEKYSGPGTYPAGLRAKPWQLKEGEKVVRSGLNYYQANAPLAKVCGLPFSWGWRNQRPIVDYVDVSGIFTSTERDILRRIVNNQTTAEDAHWISKQLAWVRLVCSYSIRRWPGKVITCLPDGARNAIKHTAPLWYVEHDRGKDPMTAWPYSRGRVRKEGAIWQREVRDEAGGIGWPDYELEEFRDGELTRTVSFAEPEVEPLITIDFNDLGVGVWFEGKLYRGNQYVTPEPPQPPKPPDNDQPRRGFFGWLLDWLGL